MKQARQADALRNDDQMPRLAEAVQIAERLGLSPPSRDGGWRGCNMSYYHSLLASTSNAILLQSCKEALLNSEERARACQVHSGRHGNQPSTALILIEDTAQDLVIRDRARTVFAEDLGIFISDGAGEQETWTMIRELTVRLVSGPEHTEVIFTAGEEEIARILYDETCVLLRCMGRVGLALELFTAAPLQSRRGYSKNWGKNWGTNIFDKTRTALSEMVGTASMSNLVRHGYGAATPRGASHWLPGRMLNSLINKTELLPCHDGFVDMRHIQFESYVRVVRSADMKLLCPACWITPLFPERQEVQEQGIIEPLRLAPPAGKTKEYTAVSYLWSEFKGEASLQDMRKSAAAVGGPTSLWIDRVCINQDDPLEKNAEIPRMGSYYAGAHTTLICPAREIVDIPRVQPSRHLVAVPEQLRKYQGLKTWKEDDWHNRVWTYQEGVLSRNPRIFAAEMNTGLSGSWLNFMSWTAESEKLVKCDVSLPPYLQEGAYTWGECSEEERWSYRHTFVRSWTACDRHNWAPGIDSIRAPLARLLDLTHLRKCTEPRDKILGLLGLAASSERFNTNLASNLKDVFCEAVRSGILGAEVLLAERQEGGPISWVPRIDSGVRVRWRGSQDGRIEYICNAKQPRVNEDGSLILRAYEIKISKHFEKSTEDEKIATWRNWLDFTNLTKDEGCCILSELRIDTRGKTYLLAGNGDAAHRQMANRIMVFVTKLREGRHVLESARAIPWKRSPNSNFVSYDKGINLGHAVDLYLSAD